MRQLVFFLLSVFHFLNGWAQAPAETSALLSKSYNARIVVAPFIRKEFKKSEDVLRVWNADFNKRIAVVKLKEAFDKRGVSTIDFAATIEIASAIEGRFKGKSEDFEQFFIRSSGADVYVVVDLDTQSHAVAGKNALKVQLTLTAYQAATGMSLANKFCESPEFFTRDIGKLTSKAIESCAADFVQTIETKWKEDILRKGRPVTVDISFAKGSKKNGNTLVGDKLLSTQIEEVVKGASQNARYNIQSTSLNKIVFNDIRIPLTDSTGSVYHVTAFADLLWSQLRKNNIPCQKEVRDNSIYMLLD